MPLTELTTNAIGGTGVFDILMSATSKYLTQEFERNRITGKEYATVYLGSITAVLQQSIAYLTVEKQNAKLAAEVVKLNAEIRLLDQKTTTEQAQLPVLTAQIALYAAQKDGFARDAEQKLAKILVDSWAVRRTTDDATTVDGTGLDDSSIGAVVEKACEGIGL